MEGGGSAEHERSCFARQRVWEKVVHGVRHARDLCGSEHGYIAPWTIVLSSHRAAPPPPFSCRRPSWRLEPTCGVDGALSVGPLCGQTITAATPSSQLSWRRNREAWPFDIEPLATRVIRAGGTVLLLPTPSVLR